MPMAGRMPGSSGGMVTPDAPGWPELLLPGEELGLLSGVGLPIRPELLSISPCPLLPGPSVDEGDEGDEGLALLPCSDVPLCGAVPLSGAERPVTPENGLPSPVSVSPW